MAKVRVVAAVLVALSMAACGKDAPSGSVSDSATFVTIVIVPALATVQEGTDFTFNVFAQYSNHEFRPLSMVTWTSSNPLMAEIDHSGYLQAVAAGELYIIAYDHQSNRMAAANVKVTALPAPPVEIITTTLPDATIGRSYQFQCLATGGRGAATWSVVNGTLPAGILLDANTGTLIGMPQGYGATYTFTVMATADSTDQQVLTLRVIDAYVPPPYYPPDPGIDPDPIPIEVF